MSCIIGADELAKTFTDRANDFIVAAAVNRSDIKTIDERAMFELIYAFVDDMLSARMRWSKSSYNYDNQLEKIFPWFAPLKNVRYGNTMHVVECEISSAFYEKILSVLEDEIIELVDDRIEDRTWNVWSISKLGRDIVLVEGPDYRILDWERRMQTGEWKKE